MGEIGSVLREARIRQNIDISAVEQATKIRAKYLRALETDEFDVLPGPTYVKTFLRTYAEYLGLDGQRLIDEYRSRHEPYRDLDVQTFRQPPKLRAHMRGPRPPSPAMLLALVLVGVLAFLLILGLVGGESPETPVPPRAPQSTTTTDRDSERRRDTRTAKDRGDRPTVPVLTVKAKRAVWVCLVDPTGKPLIAAETIAAGEKRGPFKAKSFRATFGNSGLVIKLSGRELKLDPTPNPVGYRITSAGIKPLEEGKRPTCT